MARGHEHSKVTPVVIIVLFGIFLLVAMLGSLATNKQSRTVDRSFAQTPLAHPSRTPTPRGDCNYFSQSTCQNSSGCNQTRNYCSTSNCPRNSSGGLRSRCVPRTIGGAPPQGSQCGWFNVNGERRYGCQSPEGFCDQGGAGTGSTFNSYCVGGQCSGTTNSCIDNRWVFTPTPRPSATPVERGGQYSCAWSGDVGTKWPIFCQGGNGCSCAGYWTCKARDGRCGIGGITWPCKQYYWDKSVSASTCTSYPTCIATDPVTCSSQ